MKKIVSNLLYIVTATTIAVAALVAASKALDAEALEECRSFEKEAHTFGDVTVPEWCGQVPRP